MLINLSNHPSNKWTSKQKREALIKFFDLIDINFPIINPEDDEKYIYELAMSYKEKCIEIFKNESDEKDDNAVHIMGEFTFTYALVSLLLSDGIKCIASTTKRIVKDLENNKSEVTFEFVRFREYKKI
ncbi:MAG: CRISPR-associated protein [Bacteroidetes bacterium]|nr:CRISPR-associated protein [Bacteroidota bacterium]